MTFYITVLYSSPTHLSTKIFHNWIYRVFICAVQLATRIYETFLDEGRNKKNSTASLLFQVMLTGCQTYLSFINLSLRMDTLCNDYFSFMWFYFVWALRWEEQIFYSTISTFDNSILFYSEFTIFRLKNDIVGSADFRV